MNQPKVQIDEKTIQIDIDEETGLFVVKNEVGDPLFKMKKYKLEDWLDWLENQNRIAKAKAKGRTNKN